MAARREQDRHRERGLQHGSGQFRNGTLTLSKETISSMKLKGGTTKFRDQKDRSGGGRSKGGKGQGSSGGRGFMSGARREQRGGKGRGEGKGGGKGKGGPRPG